MAQYLKEQGQNEKVRIVELNDGAKTLDEAFHKMWEVGRGSKAKKHIHHVSINPMKDERLTGKQVLAIVERLEQKYGYTKDQHQRVIVEHVKDGRQHFHVVWNRVSKQHGKAVWPSYHIRKSKEAAREMEKELGLKSPTPRRARYSFGRKTRSGTGFAKKRRGSTAKRSKPFMALHPARRPAVRRIRPPVPFWASFPMRPKPFYPIGRKRRKKNENIPDSEKLPFRRPEWELAELLAWAWETKNYAVLTSFGIHLDPESFEP